MTQETEMIDPPPRPTARTPAPGGGAAALYVFVGLLAVYLANGAFLHYDDTQINAVAAAHTIQGRANSFRSSDFPEAFAWRIVGPRGEVPVRVLLMTPVIEELRDNNVLQLTGPKYVVQPTIRPDQYVNTFGWGVTWSALPVFAALLPWLDDPQWRYWALMWGGKLASSLYVAGSAAIVLLIARRYTSHAMAILVSLAYGLGTAVWSMSSQTLWQHGPSEFFLALGTYGLLRWRESRWFVVLCSLSFAWATWCRHPSAVAVIAAGVFFLIEDRKSLAVFVLAGFPLGIGMFALNAWYYGHPLHFGELLVPELAVETTGSSAMWRLHLGESLPGMLVSPSRGLFVFSPFLLFAVWGAWETWRRDELRELRPVTVAVGLLWLVHAFYYDWWGGWSYGYRQIVDSATLLAVLLAPIMAPLRAHRLLWRAFLAMLAWSIFVQAVGAWSFDVYGWNERPAVLRPADSGSPAVQLLEFSEAPSWRPPPDVDGELVHLNIDLKQNRHRLWSLRDNAILYYVEHLADARRLKRWINRTVVRPCSQRTAEMYQHLAVALEEVGRDAEAARLRGLVAPDR